MSGAASPPAAPPLEDALLAWMAAMNAVEEEAYRIATSGAVDLSRLTELRAAAETARQQGEKLAVGVLADMDAKESRR
jgi:hypothetical protein